MNDLEDRLERLERKLDTVLSLLRAQGASAPRAGRSDGSPTPPHNAGHEVASDADLDGPRGNPEVRFVPKRWSGADHKGRRFSDCEPEFLDMLADAYEWFAQRDDESGAVDKNGNPKSRWSRLDASRARGWSARLRGGGGRGQDMGMMSEEGLSRARRPNPGASRGAIAAIEPADMGMSDSGADDEIPF